MSAASSNGPRTQAEVGRRARRAGKLAAPSSDYSDAEGGTLTLRGSLTAGSRREYARELSGEGAPASATREDSWQRAMELLFERLAVRWVIAGVPVEGQRALLERLRIASPAERAWVRDALREHCAEHFPDVTAL
jgi:hypothetical protein